MWSFFIIDISIAMPSGLHSDEKGGPLQRGFLAKLQYTDPKTLDQAMRHGMEVFRPLPRRQSGEARF